MKESFDKKPLNRSYDLAKGVRNKVETVGMELKKAKWCTDCAEIYQGEACPHCGSTVYWWLSKMLHVMRRSPKGSLHRVSRPDAPQEAGKGRTVSSLSSLAPWLSNSKDQSHHRADEQKNYKGFS